MRPFVIKNGTERVVYRFEPEVPTSPNWVQLTIAGVIAFTIGAMIAGAL